ncbi:MAG: hypothetical protein M1817_001208 [Caeruleum heppii]|nr:MAG: hypothetical protein M1817_001208 [Caeruleum heppii]
MSSEMPQAHTEAEELKLKESSSPTGQVIKYLVDNVPVFAALDRVRKRGWENRAVGDQWFKDQRARADNADENRRAFFFDLMKAVGRDLHGVTGAFSPACCRWHGIKVLDLCMAPGGFSTVAHERYPAIWGEVDIEAVTLPVADGGHPVLLDQKRCPVHVVDTDITMLSDEFGLPSDDVWVEKPDFIGICPTGRFPIEPTYDLIICDGQTLRTQQRPESRDLYEPMRLTNAQLITALQRIKPGGTLVMLLHKVEAWHCVQRLALFNRFSKLQLFKHKTIHAKRSSYYLVAKDVQPDCEAAREAMKCFKQKWHSATHEPSPEVVSDEEVEKTLREFGPRLIELGRPIWAIQAAALERAPFVAGGASGT